MMLCTINHRYDKYISHNQLCCVMHIYHPNDFSASLLPRRFSGSHHLLRSTFSRPTHLEAIFISQEMNSGCRHRRSVLKGGYKYDLWVR